VRDQHDEHEVDGEKERCGPAEQADHEKQCARRTLRFRRAMRTAAAPGTRARVRRGIQVPGTGSERAPPGALLSTLRRSGAETLAASVCDAAFTVGASFLFCC
jgi:hypothetical protein